MPDEEGRENWNWGKHRSSHSITPANRILNATNDAFDKFLRFHKDKQGTSSVVLLLKWIRKLELSRLLILCVVYENWQNEIARAIIRLNCCQEDRDLFIGSSHEWIQCYFWWNSLRIYVQYYCTLFAHISIYKFLPLLLLFDITSKRVKSSMKFCIQFLPMIGIGRYSFVSFVITEIVDKRGNWQGRSIKNMRFLHNLWPQRHPQSKVDVANK